MEKIEAIKILIKDHYDKKEDLVSRPLVRAYNKIKSTGVNAFISEEGIYLYGYKKDDNIYELFTEQLLDIKNIEYEVIDSKEVLEKIKNLKKEEIGMIYALIKKLVFGEDSDINFMEVSTMEELARDRAYHFADYNDGLSTINPYDKEHPNDYNLSLVERSKNR